jgi:hypothetical protein
MRRVTLLIPDSSPLISLAIGNSLDLLLKLDIPIRLVDVVYWETVLDHEKPGAAEIEKFVGANPKAIEVVETTVGNLLKDRRMREPDFRWKNLGEAAISEFLADLDDHLPDNNPVLVLFDDLKAQKKQIYLHGRAHLLTTMSLLDGMEKMGLIPSAQEIVDRIRDAGREISLHRLDIEAPSSSGGSYWEPDFH